LHDLIINGLRHFLPSVANIHAPHAARTIEQALTITIIYIDAIALINHGALILTQLGNIVPGMYKLIIDPL